MPLPLVGVLLLSGATTRAILAIADDEDVPLSPEAQAATAAAEAVALGVRQVTAAQDGFEDAGKPTLLVLVNDGSHLFAEARADDDGGGAEDGAADSDAATRAEEDGDGGVSESKLSEPELALALRAADGAGAGGDPDAGAVGKAAPPPEPTAAAAAAAAAVTTTPLPWWRALFGRTAVAAEEAVEEAELRLCVICFDKDCDSVFLPCGHGGVCYECGTNTFVAGARRCCFCRNAVEQVVTVETGGPATTDAKGRTVVKVVGPTKRTPAQKVLARTVELATCSGRPAELAACTL